MGQLASKEPKPKGGGLTNLADDANIEALEDEIKRAQDAALGFTAQAELLAQEVRLEQQLAALDNDALLGDPVEDAAAATGGHGDGGQLGGMLLDEANGLGDLDPEELAELEGELQELERELGALEDEALGAGAAVSGAAVGAAEQAQDEMPADEVNVANENK